MNEIPFASHLGQVCLSLSRFNMVTKTFLLNGSMFEEYIKDILDKYNKAQWFIYEVSSDQEGKQEQYQEGPIPRNDVLEYDKVFFIFIYLRNLFCPWLCIPFRSIQRHKINKKNIKCVWVWMIPYLSKKRIVLNFRSLLTLPRSLVLVVFPRNQCPSWV